MTNQQTQYYFEMLRKNRLFPLKYDGKTHGFVTFFIGNGNPEKYVRDDPWIIIDEEPNGNVCYIDHLLTDKLNDNVKHSLECWFNLKKYLHQYFPNVKRIRWNRFKQEWNEPKTFKEEI